jgi:hypothetical protein
MAVATSGGSGGGRSTNIEKGTKEFQRVTGGRGSGEQR